MLPAIFVRQFHFIIILKIFQTYAPSPLPAAWGLLRPPTNFLYFATELSFLQSDA
jgi:hypothetical protein